jgi:hypothetical protein
MPIYRKLSVPVLAFERYAILIGISIIAMLIGASLCFEFGRGFRPLRSTVLPALGQIETIRFPVGARRISELTSLLMTMPSADDFGKVFLNNYIVLSTESADNVYYFLRSSELAKKVSSQYGVRRNLSLTSRDVVDLVVPGWNFVVLEIENSFWGTCNSSIDIVVNGQRLERFPRNFPRNRYPEKSVLDQGLVNQFNKVEAGSMIDALCSRRILAFYLDH